MTEKELNNFLKIFIELKKDSKEKRYGFDDDWNSFIKKIFPLSPKSYGTKIQNRIIEKNNLISVKANENKGDFKKNNKYFEIKTSLITITNDKANITGIRTWQEIEGYYIFIIDLRNIENIKTYSFTLTKIEMNEELSTLKASAVNGTKKANENNNKIPLRFGLSLESEDFKRWKNKYLLKNKDEVVKEI